jgi:hypothetical protein
MGNSIGVTDMFSAFVGALVRIGFALVVIAAAIVALFASAMVGILVALGALVLRLAYVRRNRSGAHAGATGRSNSASHGDDKPKHTSQAILDAHKTAQGWVVEPTVR